jgi:2-phospho-L-lactate guanylyltransferase (CobY/MobA/RfbA family)
MNPKERLIKMMTDEQLRALRSSQIAAQAAALKQASFLNTGTTAAFADIDERAAIILAALPTLDRASLETLDAASL